MWVPTACRPTPGWRTHLRAGAKIVKIAPHFHDDCWYDKRLVTLDRNAVRSIGRRSQLRAPSRRSRFRLNMITRFTSSPTYGSGTVCNEHLWNIVPIGRGTAMQLRVFWAHRNGSSRCSAFGCGRRRRYLMVRGEPADQERTVARAIAAGVNYFDTRGAVRGRWRIGKATWPRFGRNSKPAARRSSAPKVRVPPAEAGRIADTVTTSLEGSLARLRLDRVDILHLHNPITGTGRRFRR